MDTFWDDSSSGSDPVDLIEYESSEVPGAPWWIAATGFALVSAVLVAGFVIDPAKAGIGAWVGYLWLWIASLLAYLIPFGFFVLRDMQIRGSSRNGYRSSPSSVSAVRISLLVFGMTVSTFFMFGFATDLSTLTGGN
jgi:hypothetical protein